MVSINSLSANKAVLASLRQISADMTATQERIATGYKVSSAKDDASVWATVQTLRSDIKAQDDVDSGVAVAKGQVDTAIQVLTSMQEVLTKLADAAGDAVLHSDTGATAINDAVQAKVLNYQKQLLALAKSATFQGKNLITTAVPMTTKIGSSGGTDITLDYTSTQVLNAAGTAGTLTTGSAAAFTSVYATVFNTATTTTTVLRDAFISAVNTKNSDITKLISELSGYSSTLTTQQEFGKQITELRKNAVSSLVDADMEEESARIQALQVKQQLAYQALSIGNSSAQNLLRLFQ